MEEYKNWLKHRIIIDSRNEKEIELLKAAANRSAEYAYKNNIPVTVFYQLLLRFCFEN
jgi:hypothetical protein